MTVNQLTKDRTPQYSHSMSQWDQISREDFFHPDWEHDVPRPVQRSALRRQKKDRAVSINAQSPSVTGTIVAGTLVVVGVALVFNRIAALLSN
jgi:hypothetical protein